MKVGDLVKPVRSRLSGKPLIEKDWNGIIIDWDGPDPVVFWSKTFPDEKECKDQIEVISESR